VIAADLGRGRFHVCEGCEWAGDGHEAESVVGTASPDFSAPSVAVRLTGSISTTRSRRKEPRGRRRSGSISALPAEPPEISSPTSRASAFAERSAAVSTTELVSAPERGEQDVIIRASEADLRHKVFDYMDLANNDIEPRRSLAYWRVNGTPQRTGPGRTIMFSTDGETVDFDAPICTTEEGKSGSTSSVRPATRCPLNRRRVGSATSSGGITDGRRRVSQPPDQGHRRPPTSDDGRGRRTDCRINPQFEGIDDAPHPDEFHDRYKDVIAETNEWRVFRVEMYPYANTVFVWNHQLGFGLRVPDNEDQFRSLVFAMMSAAEEVA